MPHSRLVNQVAEAGYHFVATSEPGVNEGAAASGTWIRRLTVRGGQPFDKFTRQLAQDSAQLTWARARYRALDLARAVLGRRRYHLLRLQIEHAVPTLVRRLGA
jgi:hypothetical protein